MNLNAETLLHRAAELDVTLLATGEVEVWAGGTVRRFGPAALYLLDVFTAARPLGQALAELGSRLAGVQALDDVLVTVAQMLESGVLRVGGRPPRSSGMPYPFGGYDAPGVQIHILQDRKRRTAYLEAVSEVVQPGDVVLDLGTGSGILAARAAAAGARRVYAVEPSNMGAYAQEVFRRNGVDDRVTLVEGWSQHLRLPELADVLTFDIVGSEPLQMNILEVTLDARRRLLRPGARLVPRGIGLALALVQVPDPVRERYSYTQPRVDAWRHWYGIDFSPLLEAGPRDTVSVFLHPAECRTFERLSDLREIWRVDLRTFQELPLSRLEAEIPVVRPGLCCGVMGVTEIDLSDSIRFVAHPDNPGAAPHWMVPLWLAARPFRVAPGDRVRVAYTYLGRGRMQVDLGGAEPAG